MPLQTLRRPCADAPTDPDLAELLKLWGKLATREQRQLLTLAKSMVD